MDKIKTGIKDNPLLYIISFGILTVILFNIPFGRYLLYPFIILGTWFHEMSHGIAAILAGGDFLYLEIYSNGAGLAAHTGSSWGAVGNAFIAGAGPLGPTFSGVVLLRLSTKMKKPGIVLQILSLILIVSVFFWIRSIFGVISILLFGIIFFISAIKLTEKGKRLLLQFLAIQSFTSVYLSIGYLFSSGGIVEGSSYLSDTQVIADNLFLPHWFWAVSILLLSVYLIVSEIKKLINQSVL